METKVEKVERIGGRVARIEISCGQFLIIFVRRGDRIEKIGFINYGSRGTGGVPRQYFLPAVRRARGIFFEKRNI